MLLLRVTLRVMSGCAGRCGAGCIARDKAA